jgi:uncharacterized protein (DUF58 family)
MSREANGVMSRGGPVVARPLGWVRRHTRPVTTLGWSVVFLALLAWSASVALGWRELMVVAGFCVVLVIAASLSMLGRLKLSASIVVEPSRVVVGERAGGSLVIKNEAARRSRPLRVEVPVGRAVARFAVPRLAPHSEHDELFVVPTQRRAVLQVGPVATVQGDSLGLVRRTHTWSEQHRIFVHPKTVPLATMAAGLVRDLEGQTTNHLTNSDIAFHTLREYVAGDDRRHVHWKTSAKLGTLMVRQYVDTRRSHICVMLSLDAADYGTDPDEFELAVSAVASVALQAVRDEQTLSVIVGGEPWAVATPRDMLDRFSGVEATTGSGGVDRCFAAARHHSAEASVTAVAFGSAVGVPELRRAASRTTRETRVLALRCDPAMSDGYRMIGAMGFVQLNGLTSLRRGLTAVM